MTSYSNPTQPGMPSREACEAFHSSAVLDPTFAGVAGVEEGRVAEVLEAFERRGVAARLGEALEARAKEAIEEVMMMRGEGRAAREGTPREGGVGGGLPTRERRSVKPYAYGATRDRDDPAGSVVERSPPAILPRAHHSSPTKVADEGRRESDCVYVS